MYGQLNYELTDALSITGGLRYSIDDKRVITQSGDVVDNSDEFVRCTPSTVAIPCLRERHKTFTNLSYTAGIDYDLTDNILIYAKYSKGYRDRKSVVKGQRVSVRIDTGGRRNIKKKTNKDRTRQK